MCLVQLKLSQWIHSFSISTCGNLEIYVHNDDLKALWNSQWKNILFWSLALYVWGKQKHFGN